MPTATPTATVRTLEKEIFARYGIPEAIHTDCGQQFVGNLMQEVGKALGIEVTNTTAYNPKGNGQVERMHRDLNAMMRAAVEDGQQDSWEDALPAALFALRTATSSTTNLTPYYLLFGRDVSQPLDVIFGQPEKPDYSSAPREYAAHLKQTISKAHAYARKNLQSAVRRQRRQYHQDRKTFLPGTKVWLFTPQTVTGEVRKLTKYWTGPWTVCAHPVNDVMVRIVPHSNWHSIDSSKAVSIDRLKLYTWRATTTCRSKGTHGGTATTTTTTTTATAAPTSRATTTTDTTKSTTATTTSPTSNPTSSSTSQTTKDLTDCRTSHQAGRPQEQANHVILTTICDLSLG